MKAIEKLAAEHDALSSNYNALLRVLHDVAAGKISRRRVTVDLQDRTWAVGPPEPEPEPLDWVAEHRAVAREIAAGAGRNGHANDDAPPTLAEQAARILHDHGETNGQPAE